MSQIAKIFFVIGLLSVALPGMAGQVEIVDVNAENRGANWRFSVTLRHADAGWDHYADAWRIVTADGKELGKRTLFHPHENEQPFTRSLEGVKIPAGTKEVFIEAHDKVHGWSDDRHRFSLID